MPTLIFTLCKHKLDRIIIGPFHTPLYVYTKWAFIYLITFSSTPKKRKRYSYNLHIDVRSAWLYTTA